MGTDYRQYPFAKGHHPAGWVETTVGDVVLEIRSGYSSGKHNQTGQGIPHLRPMNVSPVGEISMEDVRYISPDVGSLRLAENDVLFTNTSSTVWVGKTALVKSPGDWAFSNHMTRLRVADGMSPEFVARQLHYLCINGYFAFHCKKHINQSSIAGKQLAEDVPFRLPPAKEQKRIASKLRRLLIRERRLRQDLDALPALMQQYRATVLEAACTGRLVPTEAELACKEQREYQPAPVLLERILNERRAKWEAVQLAKMRAAGKEPEDDKWREKYEEPAPPKTPVSVELPAGWTWANLDQLKHFSIYGPRFSNRDYASAGTPVLRTSDINPSGKVDVATAPKLRLNYEDLSKYYVWQGDLLITRTGSLGTVAVFNDEIKAIPGAYLIHFRLAAPTITSWYVFQVLRSPRGQEYLQGQGTGIGRQNLNVPILDAFPIPLPPLAEQERIVAEINRSMEIIESIESLVTSVLEDSSRLRVSLFHHAVSGNMVSQSRQDGRASFLLKRIEASKKSQSEKRKKEVRKTMKKRTQISTEKRDLLEVLARHPAGLTPDQLLTESGYAQDEVPAFYQKLRKIEKNIQVTRPDRKVVVLKRREP